MNRVLKYDKNEFSIIELEIEEGIKIPDKNKEYEIEIIDEKLKKSVVEKKFNKDYKKLIAKILEEDDNDDGEKVRVIDNYILYFERKYGKYLTKRDLNRYLKMLNMLKEEVEEKLRELVQEKGMKR